MVRLERSKEIRRSREANRILEKLRGGSAIVEGKHDVRVLEKLGVRAFTYDSVVNGNVMPKEPIFLLMDLDKNGEYKKEKVAMVIEEKGLSSDTGSGLRLLRMLNSTCVEEIYSPLMQALEGSKGVGQQQDKPRP